MSGDVSKPTAILFIAAAVLLAVGAGWFYLSRGPASREIRSAARSNPAAPVSARSGLIQQHGAGQRAFQPGQPTRTLD